MGTAARAPQRRTLVAPAHASQIKTRERVRDLAEVYTHKREVDAMLDLVADMSPSAGDPGNTDRKFLEPAAGSGNFLVEILRRKLAYVTAHRYRQLPVFEHRVCGRWPRSTRSTSTRRTCRSARTGCGRSWSLTPPTTLTRGSPRKSSPRRSRSSSERTSSARTR